VPTLLAVTACVFLIVRLVLGDPARLLAAILSAGHLGCLGLGTQPPTPEWGTMRAKARDFLGDGLRDALDSRTAGRPWTPGPVLRSVSACWIFRPRDAAGWVRPGR
jgi:hypothetical protein